jgi:hypothetical protein
MIFAGFCIGSYKAAMAAFTLEGNPHRIFSGIY